jgi:hypothetical protein
MDKVIAAIPKGQFLTQREIFELTRKITQEEEARGTSGPVGDSDPAPVE